MAKFGGFPGGGMPNMQNLMRQAKKMQEELQQKQEEVSAKEIETSAGGGAVVVKATGDKVIKEIIIKKEVVDPDDVEMLQDLVLTAVNEALSKARKIAIEIEDLKKQSKVFRMRFKMLVEAQLDLLNSEDWDKLLKYDVDATEFDIDLNEEEM